MSKLLKILIGAIVGIFLLVIIAWLGLAAYVNFNKQYVLKEINQQLNDNINGTITIGSIEPSLIRGFPGISVTLGDVILRDSLWDVHKHDLLNAKRVYVSVDALSVLRKKTRIKNIQIEDAKVYLFTDSSGYSNTKILKPNPHKKKGHLFLDKLLLVNTHLTFENKSKFKLFEFAISKVSASIFHTDTSWSANTHVNTTIKNFTFNTHNGSFLRNKNLNGDLKFSFDLKAKVLSIPLQTINIDNDKLHLSGRFWFAQQPAAFVLNIRSDGIKYKNAIALVSPNISSKLKAIDLEKKIELKAYIYGHMKFRDTPLVKINWTVKDNTLKTPGGDIEECNFTGTFINEAQPGSGHNDINSIIALSHFKGEWFEIPFNADTVTVSNLTKPVIEGKFKAHTTLSVINKIANQDDFAFSNGTVDVNLLYRCALQEDDTTAPYIVGTVGVHNAAITYMPRNLKFTNSNVTLRFTGSDLFVDNARLQTGSNVLTMNGAMRNFLNLYYTNPEKILINWNVSSPSIKLDEFRSFITNHKVAADGNKQKGQSKNSRINRAMRQLNRLLNQGSVHLIAKVNRLTYRKFSAENANADVVLGTTGIDMKQVSIQHAGGTINLNAFIGQNANVNKLAVHSKINNVNVRDLFTSFENFGQNAITDDNLRGKLTADVNVTGLMSGEGKILPSSFNGIVDFKLKDGALVNFGPFLKVSKYIFRKRNMDNVTFSDIENKLDIQGNKIQINPMHIESSALTVNVNGVYSFSKGTDINIDVPLRNPKKDELIVDDAIREKQSMKGIVIHLKAVDGDSGGVKIKWLMHNNERKSGDVLD